MQTDLTSRFLQQYKILKNTSHIALTKYKVKGKVLQMSFCHFEKKMFTQINESIFIIYQLKIVTYGNIL